MDDDGTGERHLVDEKRMNKGDDPADTFSHRRCSRPRRLPATERLLMMLLGLSVALAGSGTAVRAEEEDQPSELTEPTSILKREGFAPTISLHGFGDVSVLGEQTDPAGGPSSTRSGFGVGELDLFIVSHLTDNISFLTEIVFEQESDGHGLVDVERFWIKYTFSDRIWASLGRHHAPFGYWNRNYHHGLLLQPTVSRPEPVQFEDHVQGGFLPIHQVGLMAGGSAFADTWRFDYVGGIFNGRGFTRKDILGTGDLNDEKAVALNLSCARETDRRILFGASVYVDDIPADPSVPGRDGEIGEMIYGAHLNYRDERFEVLSEFYRVDHHDQVSLSDFDSSGYFLIGIWRPWRWKPYVGYERMNIAPGDPYFAGLIDLKRYRAGVRFDAHPFVAVKFEYQHDDRPGVETDALAIQVAFTF